MSAVATPRRLLGRRVIGERRGGPITYLVLTLTTVLAIFPLYWTVVAASRTNADISKTPPPLTPGGNLFSNIREALDQVDMFNGALDRYDWKLVGKKEIYVPYNAYTLSIPILSYKELLNDDLRPLIEKYYRASDSSAEQRIKLFKLIWDALGTEFGGRHALYERNYSGNNEQIRLDVVNFARVKGHLGEFGALADQCMSEYDLDGWTVPPWDWQQRKSV